MVDAQTARSSHRAGREPGELYQERIALVTARLAELIDIEFRANPFRAIETRFAIAHAPRTGSYLLCEHLRTQGAAVREFFHPDRVARAQELYGVGGLPAFCRKTIKEFSVRGAFGVKGAFDILAPLVLAGEFPEFRADWKFVYLTRQDAVKRAVSQFKADLTGQWLSSQKAKRQLSEEDFNGKRIKAIIDQNQILQDTWEDTFNMFEITPLRITYEEIASAPGAAAAKVARFVGLDGRPITNPNLMGPTREKQADALNENWAERFRQEGWI